MSIFMNAPKQCDVCKNDLVDTMYDCYVPAYQSWGCICERCFTNSSAQIGTGKGQQYKQLDSKWLKTGG